MAADELPQAEVLARVVAALRSIPEVIAIGAYGSTADQSWNAFSDIDVMAVLAVDPPVESLRFFVAEIAVDLNFRSADDGPRGIGGSDFVPACVAVWDPNSLLERARVTPRTHRSEATQMMRFQFTHDLQKARQIEQADERRIGCGLIAHRVLECWFQARNEPFPGIVGATAGLRQRDPETLRLINDALAHGDPELIALAGERALSPVGGPYRSGDVLAPSWNRPAVEPVPTLFASLTQIADAR
ncbi:MAG: hypothetical protein QOK28_1618 [Actinomycetota bacterium]|jgi:hypothetical protein